MRDNYNIVRDLQVTHIESSIVTLLSKLNCLAALIKKTSEIREPKCVRYYLIVYIKTFIE